MEETSIGLDELLGLADELESNEQGAEECEARGSEDTGSGFDAEEVELLSSIGQALSEAMSVKLRALDLNDKLSDEEHQELMFTIFDKILKAMKKKGSKELDEEDHAYIKASIEKLAIKHGLQPPRATKHRFAPLDRVICRVNRSDRAWAAGSIQALDQENEEKDPYKTFPYVVKIDPPSSFGFSAPEDTNDYVRAEVCFGQRSDALLWTLRCLPQAKARGSRPSRRFRVGERVACAVENASDDGYTEWAAGTVDAVDHPVDGFDGLAGGAVPYKVALDSGACVLVHRDEHWLVRDLALQPAGPRTSEDGTREVARIGKRKLSDDDSCQMVDHVTRNVRRVVQEPDDPDD